MVNKSSDEYKGNYINLEFGDIIKVSFSPATGQGQQGYRPGLVISDPITQLELNGLVTVAPITSNVKDFFTRVNLDKYGLKTKGDFLVDQVKVLDLSNLHFISLLINCHDNAA
jgi:mRNA interferase MazF